MCLRKTGFDCVKCLGRIFQYMALIIYLDTQDYIKLFNEPTEGPNHQVLTDLLAYRDRGEIVIGFSFATIMEFITKPDAANRRERVRRGQLIKDICGPNAFPYPTAIPKGASFPNDGCGCLGVAKSLCPPGNFGDRCMQRCQRNWQRREA